MNRAAHALVVGAQPDITVIDCMLTAPLRGALAANRPSAVLFHTFGSYWSRNFDRGPAGRALGLLGLRPRSLWDTASTRLMLTDAELDPSSSSPGLRNYT
ncbi:MAG: hypothetical protein KA158_06460, partial [Leucobacter sp.]|nr:hypothetical protein [Leucobacter sp.]